MSTGTAMAAPEARRVGGQLDGWYHLLLKEGVSLHRLVQLELLEYALWARAQLGGEATEGDLEGE